MPLSEYLPCPPSDPNMCDSKIVNATGYGTSTRTKYVRRGRPVAGGLGVQYAKANTVTSNETTSAVSPTLLKAFEGPPDFFPHEGTSAKTVKASMQNQLSDGTTSFQLTFEVNTAVYVSKVVVYETDHPGAIVKITGFDSDGVTEITFWEASQTSGVYNVHIPAGSSVSTGGGLTTSHRAFEPPITAPRNKRFHKFRIYQQINLVDGPNAMDAVEVWGDDVDGLPVEDYGTKCGLDPNTDVWAHDCWYECRAGTGTDVVLDQDSTYALQLLQHAADWLTASLTVPANRLLKLTAKTAPEANREVLPMRDGRVDGGNLWCDDVQLSPSLATSGLPATGLLIVPTFHPSHLPVTAWPCQWHTKVNPAFASDPTQPATIPDYTAPTVIRVNMVPGFARSALQHDMTGRRKGTRMTRLATDALLHEIYKAIGWGFDHTSMTNRNNDLNAVHGAGTVATNTTTTCTSFMSCTEPWATRYTITTTQPAMLAKAREHFGYPTMARVEFEQNYGDGRYSLTAGDTFGSDPHCSWAKDTVHHDHNQLLWRCNPGMLLETRLFLGELMAPSPSYGRLAYVDPATKHWVFPTSLAMLASRRSAISLAMFEDLGYFKPDYGAAESFVYGNGLGAAFVDGACSAWPSTVVDATTNAPVSTHYLCPESVASPGQFDTSNSGARGCSPQRTHKAVCLINSAYTNTVQNPYLYFVTGSTAMGGYTVDADYCPLMAPSGISWQKPGTTMFQYQASPTDVNGAFSTWGNCLVEDQQPATNTLFEETGAASRCLTATSTMPAGQSATVGCYKTHCHRDTSTTPATNVVYVKLTDSAGNSEWKPCATPTVASPKPTVYFSAGMLIECPRVEEVCPTFSHDTGYYLKVYGFPAPTVEPTTNAEIIHIPQATIDITVETGAFTVDPTEGTYIGVYMRAPTFASGYKGGKDAGWIEVQRFTTAWGTTGSGDPVLTKTLTLADLPETPQTWGNGKDKAGNHEFTNLSIRLMDKYGQTHGQEDFLVWVQHYGIEQVIQSGTTGSSQYTLGGTLSAVNQRPFDGAGHSSLGATGLTAGLAASNTSWSPTNAGGRNPASDPTAWLLNNYVYNEYLDVSVAIPIIPTSVSVYENWSRGNLTQVEIPNAAALPSGWETIHHVPRRDRFTMDHLVAGTTLEEDRRLTRTGGGGSDASEIARLTPQTRFRLTWGLYKTSWPEVASITIKGNARDPPNIRTDRRPHWSLRHDRKSVLVVHFELTSATTFVWRAYDYAQVVEENTSARLTTCTNLPCPPLSTTTTVPWARVLNRTGVARGPTTIKLNVEIDPSLMSREHHQQWSAQGMTMYVKLFNALYDAPDLGVKSGTATNFAIDVPAHHKQPDGTYPYQVPVMLTMRPRTTLRGPQCRHGAWKQDHELDTGVCQCFPGAHGLSCEFLTCPNDCSNSHGSIGGTCDASTGTCVCHPHRYGLDCSGSVGSCSLSYSGACPAGSKPGTVSIDTEDDNNGNLHSGSVPSKTKCTGQPGAGRNQFGCSEMVTLDMCCYEPSITTCPFQSGNAGSPCGTDACVRSVGVASEDLSALLASDVSGGYMSGACKSLTQTYCYNNPHDPACHGVEKLTTVPANGCPHNLAMKYCSDEDHVQESECVTYLNNQTCRFAAASGLCTGNVTSPCWNATKGRYDFAMSTCAAAMSAYCTETDPTTGRPVARTDDRECRVHGYGNGCLFHAGSTPCTAYECLGGHGFSAQKCRATIDTYCNAAPTADPQCLAEGYGNATAGELFDSYTPDPLTMPSTCPMSLLAKQCELTPADPYCVALALQGLVDVSAVTPANTADPATTASSTHATSLNAARARLRSFAALDETKRVITMRCTAMYRDLWLWADANADDRLTNDEWGAWLAHHRALRLHATGQDRSCVHIISTSDFEDRIFPQATRNTYHGGFISNGYYNTVVQSRLADFMGGYAPDTKSVMYEHVYNLAQGLTVDVDGTNPISSVFGRAPSTTSAQEVQLTGLGESGDLRPTLDARDYTGVSAVVDPGVDQLGPTYAEGDVAWHAYNSNNVRSPYHLTQDVGGSQVVVGEMPACHPTDATCAARAYT